MALGHGEAADRPSTYARSEDGTTVYPRSRARRAVASQGAVSLSEERISTVMALTLHSQPAARGAHPGDAVSISERDSEMA